VLHKSPMMRAHRAGPRSVTRFSSPLPLCTPSHSWGSKWLCGRVTWCIACLQPRYLLILSCPHSLHLVHLIAEHAAFVSSDLHWLEKRVGPQAVLRVAFTSTAHAEVGKLCHYWFISSCISFLVYCGEGSRTTERCMQHPACVSLWGGSRYQHLLLSRVSVSVWLCSWCSSPCVRTLRKLYLVRILYKPSGFLNKNLSIIIVEKIRKFSTTSFQATYW